MNRTQKRQRMEQIIRESELPQKELISILAYFLTDSDPEKVAAVLQEMKQRSEELERRSRALLEELRKDELKRFDPMI